MELKRKIWTVFEDSIRYTELVKDRHLDQLLMCAVYVICKICNVQLTFENIMKYYREQPQATSSIYRSVLLQRKSTEERGKLVIYVRIWKGKQEHLFSLSIFIYLSI